MNGVFIWVEVCVWVKFGVEGRERAKVVRRDFGGDRGGMDMLKKVEVGGKCRKA